MDESGNTAKAWAAINSYAVERRRFLQVAGVAGMGVYVSERSVRVRGLLRSQTLEWQEIASFRLHQTTHRLGRLQIPSGLTVLIERCDGGMVNTELWAQGVDFHSRPGLFRAVFHDLRERHLAATRATA